MIFNRLLHIQNMLENFKCDETHGIPQINKVVSFRAPRRKKSAEDRGEKQQNNKGK